MQLHIYVGPRRSVYTNVWAVGTLKHITPLRVYSGLIFCENLISYGLQSSEKVMKFRLITTEQKCGQHERLSTRENSDPVSISHNVYRANRMLLFLIIEKTGNAMVIKIDNLIHSLSFFYFIYSQSVEPPTLRPHGSWIGEYISLGLCQLKARNSNSEPKMMFYR